MKTFLATRTFMVENPSADKHYRTTHLPQGAPVVAYVETKRDWQIDHSHHFAQLTRFGTGICHDCGALGWSPQWVSAGLYGDGTQTWIEEQEREHRDLVDRSAVDVALDVLGGTLLVAADLSADMPAKR